MMNDRFKFRAWDKETKSFLIHNEEDKTFDFNVFNSVLKRPEKYVVLQCTGLKDKNGKLIYEGDIVVYKGTLPEETAKVVPINKKFEPIKFAAKGRN